MKSIFLFFSMIFLFASCNVKLPEGCSPDSFSFKESLWAVDMESSSIISMQSGWESEDIEEIRKNL